MLLVAIFAFATLSYSQNGAFGVQGGYSWINGLIGAQYQMGHLAIGGGYYPAIMPGSGKPVSSFSGVFTLYGGDWDESCYYLSIGIASAGYRYEISYGGGPWINPVVKPMTILMGGVKYASYSNWYTKGGIGVGWCDEATVFTWEITLGYYFSL